MIIYKIKSKTSGKIYIGQTIRELSVRKSEHHRAAQQLHRQKYPTPLHKAIREEGSGNFEWEVLETCVSVDHLNEREKVYIKLLNTLTPNGFNQTTGGAIDSTMSEKTRQRIADTMKLNHKDPEFRKALYPQLKGLTPPNKGKPMSDAQKAKVSAAKKAVYADPNYVNPNVGTTRTEDQKVRIKAGQVGKMATGEAWAAAHKDQYTVAVRAKMSEAKKGKKPANTRKVRCIETGQVFNGLTEAAAALDINRQSIWMQIKGKLKAAGGKHFEYV